LGGEYNYCYRLAERLIGEELSRIAEKATNNRLDPRTLSSEYRALIMMYSRAQETWQQVCLVLSADSIAAKATEAVVLNRPLARRMDKQLAGLLLYGQQSEALPAFDAALIDRCVEAFGGEAAVYLGGPHRQLEAGLCVHGFGSLPGALELAPGTRIYSVGVEAAIQGVLAGKFAPLDFRWFVGRHTDLSTTIGEWSAIACARPIALKQCLGLPKPLWHEVMELCGGENGALSRLELLKRDDLEDDSEQA